jgi:hypothetical protein
MYPVIETWFCRNVKISRNRWKNVFVFELVYYKHLHLNGVTVQRVCGLVIV